MKRLRIVTLGGGTGSFTLLTGLKQFEVELAAIVNMSDDGGSTGILRDELGVLPPGDVRQCLVALSESSEVMRNLLSYRFESGKLKGHSFGNLFLSALEKISGNYDDALAEAVHILNVKGDVIPITTDKGRLMMRLGNGKEIQGEHQVSTCHVIQKYGVKKFYFKPQVTAHKRAIKKIKTADLVIIGPGNHYGTILPNLLVTGIAPAINRSKAIVVYVCNLTNKKGQTTNYTVNDYITDVQRYLNSERMNYVIFNTFKPSDRLLKKYTRKEGGGSFVKIGPNASKNHYTIIKGDFLSRKDHTASRSDALAHQRAFIRHDSKKLAQALMKLIT